MKVLLAVGAVLVALLTAGVSGQVLTATGDEPPARGGQARSAADEKDASRGNQAARTFVSAKRSWTACVAGAARTHDPKRTCGPKPHPHDVAGKHEHGHGPPPWAGGPTRRTAEPPGHARRE